MAAFLTFVFAFFLSEAMVTGCCDADLAQSGLVQSGLVASGHQSGPAPADQTPAPGGAHVCQCAHATNVFSSTPPRTVVVLAHHVATAAVTPAAPPSRTLQPDSRPPIA
jgi:hypothetical protein